MNDGFTFKLFGKIRFDQSRAGNLAYITLALGLIFYVLTIWVEVYCDTRPETKNSTDKFYQSHRQWRLRTAFLFLMWSIFAGFSVPFGFGLIIFTPVYLWFVYRTLKGLIYFYARIPIVSRSHRILAVK